MNVPAAALAAVAILSCGMPPVPDGTPAAQRSEPVEATDPRPPAANPSDRAAATDAGVPDGAVVPAVRPQLMEVTPNPAQPGDMLRLVFPEETLRGVAFSLYRRSRGDWELSYHLHSDGSRGGGYQPLWREAGSPPGHDDVGVGGTGPDQVPLPDIAAPGEYLICTANAAVDFCAPLAVEPADGAR